MATAPQVLRYIFELLYEEYAFAALTRVRLADERELGMCHHVLFKASRLLWQLERDGRKAELLLESLTHAVSNGAEDFLARQVLDAGITIPIKLVLRHLLEVFMIER